VERRREFAGRCWVWVESGCSPADCLLCSAASVTPLMRPWVVAAPLFLPFLPAGWPAPGAAAGGGGRERRAGGATPPAASALDVLTQWGPCALPCPRASPAAAPLSGKQLLLTLGPLSQRAPPALHVRVVGAGRHPLVCALSCTRPDLPPVASAAGHLPLRGAPRRPTRLIEGPAPRCQPACSGPPARHPAADRPSLTFSVCVE
jgi:hypothetical protein